MLGFLFGKKQIIVEDAEYFYYSDGKKTPKKKLLRGETIRIMERDGYTCKSRKPRSAKYIYKTKKENEEIYCYTNTLNTDFLNLIIRNEIEKEKPVLLKISDKLAILFFKNSYIPLTGKNWEEILKQTESILQGLPFSIAEYKNITKFIKKSDFTNTLINTLIWVVVGLGGYFIYEQLTYTPPPPPPKKPVVSVTEKHLKPHKKPKPKEKHYLFEDTYKFIAFFFSQNLPSYIFVKDLSFDSYTITLASFFPLPDFVLKGNFYENKILVNPKALKMNIPAKDIIANKKYCATLLNQYPILQSSPDYILYQIQLFNQDVDEVANLLYALGSCPVIIKGNISFVNLLERNVNLKVYLLLNSMRK
jgi:hypothetical protein